MPTYSGKIKQKRKNGQLSVNEFGFSMRESTNKYAFLVQPSFLIMQAFNHRKGYTGLGISPGFITFFGKKTKNNVDMHSTKLPISSNRKPTHSFAE